MIQTFLRHATGLLVGLTLIPSPPGVLHAATTEPAATAPATMPTAAPTLATFEQRRQSILDDVWARYQAHVQKPPAKEAFWNAEALFQLGKIEEGRRMAHRGLDQLFPGNKENRWIHGGNSGFIALPGIDCYVRYNQFFDDALKQRYRTIYTGAVFYRRLTTSNHKIMAAVTRYLATQVWGNDAFKPDPFFPPDEAAGSFFTKNDPTGEQYCRSIIDETLKRGPGEYASRPYGSVKTLPLLILADCSANPEIRQRAKLAYELCLIQLAPAYLGGHLATFSTRSYPDMETQQPWGVAVVLWIYFGGITPNHLSGQWAMRAAFSDYRPPDVLIPAATDRSQPYVYRSRANKWALYHFVNRHYVLFSRSPKAEKPVTLGQNYPCGVMWEEPDLSLCSHFWITNPAADNNQEENNKATGIHTHGVTRFEQQLQHRDTSVSVFNIPPNWRNPYVLGFVPGGHLAAINDSRTTGRIFLHYRNVLIAVCAEKPFDWDPKAGIRAPAAKTRPGDSEFRVMATQTAVALETALPGEFAGETPEARLAAFRDAVLAKSNLEIKDPLKPEVLYINRHGDRLQSAFNEVDSINGQNVDYATWPILENPWMSYPVGGLLTLTDGKTVRTYDLPHYTVTETPAKPQ